RSDLDSIYLSSSRGANAGRNIHIESNALTANVSGNYQLSKLPNSVIFYLSGYLPNYIKAPTTYTPNQDISFSIITREIDSLLGVVIPTIQGFNNATISGKLNTDI